MKMTGSLFSKMMGRKNPDGAGCSVESRAVQQVVLYKKGRTKSKLLG